MHLTALLLGAFSLVIAIIVKKTPYEWTKIFPKLNENEEESKLPGGYQDAFERSKTAMLMDED